MGETAAELRQNFRSCIGLDLLHKEEIGARPHNAFENF